LANSSVWLVLDVFKVLWGRTSVYSPLGKHAFSKPRMIDGWRAAFAPAELRPGRHGGASGRWRRSPEPHGDRKLML